MNTEEPPSKRMKTPINGPLVKPVMTVSQPWYDARVEEVYQLECRIRGLEFVRDKKQDENDCLETELDNVRDAYEKLEQTNREAIQQPKEHLDDEQHECEYQMARTGEFSYIRCKHCKESLEWSEVYDRLNEYPALKKATEALRKLAHDYIQAYEKLAFEEKKDD